MRFALLLFLGTVSFAQDSPSTHPDAREIIRKSVERDLFNYERLKNYTYTERDEARVYNTHGKLTKKEIESYDILILGGHDYSRLIERDDKPLPEKDAKKEQAKLDKEIEKRDHESPQEKAKLEKQRREERKFLDEVPEGFNFRLLGEEEVSGNPAWVIQADPKPGYVPKDRRAKIITKLAGKVWIDEKEYQWVKVEARAMDKVSFGFHLVQVEPGATLHFEQTRVNDEIWLPAAAKIYVDARLALFKKLHSEIDIQFRGYKKFQAESHLVASGPVSPSSDNAR